MEHDRQAINESLKQVLKIAQERCCILENLKEALVEDNIEKIKKHAKAICGMTNHEQSH